MVDTRFIGLMQMPGASGESAPFSAAVMNERSAPTYFSRSRAMGRIGQPLEKHNPFPLATPAVGDENRQPISELGRQRQPPSEPSVF